MIWLTWRQFRASAALTAAVLVVLTAVLALTGPDLAADYAAGIAGCVPDDTCLDFFDRFFGAHDLPFLALTLVVLVLPALVGVFWGAPLVARELEAGTHLLVWSQSVTRGRWLAVKLGLTGLAAVAAAGVCGLVVTWWSGPLDRSAVPEMAQMAPVVFGARGVAPMGYAAFAFVLGVTLGVLFRRTLPAMALTLVVFAAVQLAVPSLVRPHLMPPVTGTFELGRENVDGIGAPQGGSLQIFLRTSAVPGQPGAWVLSSELVDPSGRAVGDGPAGVPGPSSTVARTVPVSTTSGPCGPPGGPSAGTHSCVAEISLLGYRQRATYQPLDRFWAFQWIETGGYALLALGLAGFCSWWLRRRPS